VEAINGDSIELRMIWGSLDKWKVEKKTRWLEASSLGAWEELDKRAPQPESDVRNSGDINLGSR